MQLQLQNNRSDISNIQAEINEHKRGERKYLELMKKEYEFMQHKNQLEEQYNILDKKEREMFSHLQATLLLLHEKSKSHTRQWGIISTIIGALLGIIGTSISAYYRNNDIKNIQQSIQNQLKEQIELITKDSERVVEALQRYEMALNKSIENKQEGAKNSVQNKESWNSFFRRSVVSMWRYCTFQRQVKNS